MTGDKLLAALAALPEHEQKLPILMSWYTYGDEMEGERFEEVGNVTIVHIPIYGGRVIVIS